MVRNLAVMTALALSGTSVAALAQSSSDVVVMRRPIATPQRTPVSTPTPSVSPTPGASPTPSVSPTPTPSPTPVASPDPTPSPTPAPGVTPTSAPARTYALVPFSVRSVATSWPLSGGLSVDASYDVRCVDSGSGSQVGSALCAGMSPSPSARVFQIPATGNQLYRTIVISASDVLAGAPSVRNADTLCNSTVKVDGASWKLRCDPSFISGQYLWVATTAQIPTQAPGATLSFKPSVSCFDAGTGQGVSSTYCSNVAVGTAADAVSIPSGFSRNLRTIAFSRDDLLSALPMLSNVASLCTTPQAITDAGTTQSWRISCNADDVREHFRRVATTASKVSSQIVPLTGAGTWQAATHLSGIVCLDTDTGAAAADSSRCDYIPNTAAMGYFDLPATFESQLRVLSVDWNSLVTRSPDLTNKAAFCSGTSAVKPAGAAAVSYAVSCDPDATRMHYQRYASTVATISSSYNLLPLSDGLALSATGVKCRDTDTGADIDVATCQYIAKGADEGIFRIPAQYSSDLRTVAVDYATLVAASPSKDAADGLCSGSVGVRLSTSATTIPYQLRCDPESIRNHFESVARTVTSIASASSGYNVIPLTDLTISAQTTECRDTDSQTYKAAADQTRCTYQSDTSGTAVKKVAAQINADLRVVVAAKADILKAYPWVTNADSFCNATTLAVRNSGSTTQPGWKLYCDNQEVLRNHYVESARTITPSSSSTNYVPFSGGLSFYSLTTECRDKDSQTYKAATDQTRCDYLTDLSETGTKKVSVQYNTELWALTIPKAELVAAYPWATNIDAICSSSINVRETANGTIESWQLRCDNPEWIRNHYAWARRTIGTTSSTNNPVAFTGGVAFGTATAECRDTDAGSTYLKVADQTRCANLNDQTSAAGSVFRVPTVSIDTPNKTVTVTKASILASSPYITAYPSFCGGKFSARNASGTAESWTLVCS